MACSEAGATRFHLLPEVLRYKVAGVRLAIVRFCWRGKMHLADETQCQDWAAIYPALPDSRESDWLVAVVADGVSTQPQSGTGAMLAAKAIGECWSKPDAASELPSVCLANAQTRFVEMCQEHRAGDAKSTSTSPVEPSSESVVEYATTALVFCIRGSDTWAASVGDGAIYGISDGGRKATMMTNVLRDGLVNEVRPLTSAKWQIGFAESAKHFQPRGDMEGFCLMTDGFSESIGNADKYFEAVWPKLKERLNNREDLTEYAEADRRFSDDDKTLLAVFYEG
jgi:hypothetical protein